MCTGMDGLFGLDLSLNVVGVGGGEGGEEEVRKEAGGG